MHQAGTSLPRRRTTFVSIVIPMAVLGVAPIHGGTPLVAQDTAPSASVFTGLDGTWEGSGTLFGRPAAFRMRREVAGEGFVRLTFSNAFVTDTGETPVLTSHAAYYVHGRSATGVWVDNRPQRITLVAAVTDSSVVTEWTAESEEGRTEYVLRSADVVVVRDIVYSNGSERVFAEATYRRR